ncbi:MAG: transketolase [candidate division Zixibacteria bacterium]|nr:transketolase [candidate division Zixibacteria bacterium]
MTFDTWRGFRQAKLESKRRAELTEMARQARGNILKMTTVANSGHPGGSMSSLEIYLMLYTTANVDPKNPYRDDRDRIIVSHGHTSPGAYVSLAAAGFFDVAPALYGFRQAGSPFEGHVERSVPGIEWDTGNLGQGLSVGVGKAIYGKLSKQDFHTYVLMGDGEQQKGQISEARRVAMKFNLSRLTAVVDYNGLQISGKITDILPQNIKGEWEADGWRVVEIDAHNLDEVYGAFYEAKKYDKAPTVILAHSTMSKGIGFMENDENYHGAAIKAEQMKEALACLTGEDLVDNVVDLLARRKQGPPPPFQTKHADFPRVDTGQPIYYKADEKSDNRSAWGKALVSVADANLSRPDFVMGVFDCDLSKSVKTDGFAKKYPANFFQCGITEHSTAATVGSLSAEKALAVWADFGVFGIDETYNQARLNDINHANVKLFCTHSGVNVGEDGKTHQCIDYFALLNSTFGWKVITPADPNQTDRIVRYVLSNPGNFAVIMGRAVIPVVTSEDGKAYFGENYRYRYGRMETIRRGEDLVLVAAGNMLPYAMQAWDRLAKDGKRISLVSVSDWCDLHRDDLDALSQYSQIVTLEDHNIKTGLGTTLAAALFESGVCRPITKLGVTHYASSGTPDDLYKMLGIDAAGVTKTISGLLQRVGTTV